MASPDTSGTGLRGRAGRPSCRASAPARPGSPRRRRRLPLYRPRERRPQLVVIERQRMAFVDHLERLSAIAPDDFTARFVEPGVPAILEGAVAGLSLGWLEATLGDVTIAWKLSGTH